MRLLSCPCSQRAAACGVLGGENGRKVASLILYPVAGMQAAGRAPAAGAMHPRHPHQDAAMPLPTRRATGCPCSCTYGNYNCADMAAVQQAWLRHQTVRGCAGGRPRPARPSQTRTSWPSKEGTCCFQASGHLRSWHELRNTSCGLSCPCARPADLAMPAGALRALRVASWQITCRHRPVHAHQQAAPVLKLTMRPMNERTNGYALRTGGRQGGALRARHRPAQHWRQTLRPPPPLLPPRAVLLNWRANPASMPRAPPGRHGVRAPPHIGPRRLRRRGCV